MQKPAIILFTCIALLGACSSGETEGGAETAVPEEAPGMTLADFAGTWSLSATVGGNEEPVLTTMSGTADASAWTLTLPDREDVPMQVSIMGDSLIGVTEQYESVLREGVMVTVRTALVMMGDELHGNLEATYQMEDGEEVVTGSMHGTRAMN